MYLTYVVVFFFASLFSFHNSSVPSPLVDTALPALDAFILLVDTAVHLRVADIYKNILAALTYGAYGIWAVY